MTLLVSIAVQRKHHQTAKLLKLFLMKTYQVEGSYFYGFCTGLNRDCFEHRFKPLP